MKYKYFKLLIISIVTIFILLMTGCNKLDINKEEDLTLALKESGLNWKIQENKYHTTYSILPNPFAIHNISDSSGLVDCWINMRYYLPPNDKTASITFSYNEQTAEDYDRFQKEDWPLFWLFAGKLFQSTEEITQLGEQCMSYYENYIGKEQEILDWKGKQGCVLQG